MGERQVGSPEMLPLQRCGCVAVVCGRRPEGACVGGEGRGPRAYPGGAADSPRASAPERPAAQRRGGGGGERWPRAVVGVGWVVAWCPAPGCALLVAVGVAIGAPGARCVRGGVRGVGRGGAVVVGAGVPAVEWRRAASRQSAGAVSGPAGASGAWRVGLPWPSVAVDVGARCPVGASGARGVLLGACGAGHGAVGVTGGWRQTASEGSVGASSRRLGAAGAWRVSRRRSSVWVGAGGSPDARGVRRRASGVGRSVVDVVCVGVGVAERRRAASRRPAIDVSAGASGARGVRCSARSVGCVMVVVVRAGVLAAGLCCASSWRSARAASCRPGATRARCIGVIVVWRVGGIGRWPSGGIRVDGRGVVGAQAGRWS